VALSTPSWIVDLDERGRHRRIVAVVRCSACWSAGRVIDRTSPRSAARDPITENTATPLITTTAGVLDACLAEGLNHHLFLTRAAAASSIPSRPN